jgi:transposase
MERRYDSDLSDAEWALIAHHFERQDAGRIKPIHPKRSIVNAIPYLDKAGAQWRLLPKGYPPWKTVYDPYRRWNERGVWEAALDELAQIHRKKARIPPRATALLTRKVSRPSPLALPTPSPVVMCSRPPWKSTVALKHFPSTKVTGGARFNLWKRCSAQNCTSQRRLKIRLRYCRSAGSSSAHLAGSVTFDACPKPTKS